MKTWTAVRTYFSVVVLLVAMTTMPATYAQSIPNQLSPNNETGTPPYVAYGGVRENINLATGDLNIQIPLLTLPGRNKLDLNIGITYDSKYWVLNYSDDGLGDLTYLWENQPSAPYLDNSWRFNLPVLQTTEQDFGARSGFSDTGCWSKFVVTMPDGGKHIFQNKAGCWGYNTTGTHSFPTFNRPLWDAQDTSLMRLDTTNPADVVLHLKDGTQIHFFSNLAFGSATMAVKVADKIEDTDGNTITITSTSSTTEPYSSSVNTITDTMGRVITFHYSGSIGPSSISYLDGSGTTRSISFGYTAPSCTPAFSLPAGSLDEGNCNSLTSVTLPNNLHYNFTYNATLGELSKITYPSGGYTRYEFATYTNLQEFATPLEANATTTEDFREISARHVCRSSTGSCGTEDTTTYTPTINGSPNNQYMDVVDASNNLTHSQFSQADASTGSSPRESDQMHYTGPTAAPSALLRTIHTDYNSPTTGDDILAIRVTTTLNDTNQVTKVENDYDSFNDSAFGGLTSQLIDNVIEQREFAYGSGTFGALIRKTDNTWLKTNSVNAADYTTTAIHIFNRKASEKVYDGASNLLAQSQFEYDKYDTSANHATLQASGAVQHDSTRGTSYSTRGNVTAAQRWRNTDGVWLSAYSQFDDAGNPLKAIDFGGHTTTFSLTDAWSNSICAPTGGSAKVYVTTVTNALTQSATSVYNSCAGTVASTTDANSQTVNNSYDLMGRLTQASLPDSGLVTRAFNESSLPLSMTPSIKITSAASLTSPIIVDGLGRVSQSQLTSDPEGTTYIDATYDEQGRKKTVSNPYRTTSDPTYGITTYNYDALGREVQLIPPDGTSSSNNITTAYSGNCTTVTDQTGKKRKICTDALGRLIQVFEPDASQNLVNETDYQYDVLNNLLCVHQRGTDATADKSCTDGTVPASWRPRTFTYNSLSQLLTASNPESGTITYTYDADGNVLTKMDARSITTTYTYDSLHRLTKKTYSDSTPTVIYGYDAVTPTGCTPPSLTITNGIGRRTAMCDAAGSEAWSYDVMGRVTVEKRTTNSVTMTSSYTYNLDGSLATITYPSGRVINYTPSAAARILSAVDIANSINYATGALYSPIGALSSVQNNTNIVSSFYYNNRLQPCRISVQTSGTAPTQCSDAAHLGNLMDLTYGYNLNVSNNGNVAQITNNLNSGRSQTFSYDEMNRIKTALTQGTSGSLCWGLDYSYDIYANFKTASLDPGRPSCPGFTLNAGVDTNNRITNTGFSYDAAGNVLSDASFSYTWDAESELKTAAGVTYTYDGDGRRVQKSNGKLYWYGAGGEILDESDVSGNITDEFVFFGGKRTARRNIASGNIYYYLADHLGTSRMIVQGGQTSACYDADFDPFGTEYIVADTCAQNYKFTGKERDSESGLDDFETRYYASGFGRFLSPDPGAAYADNPQTLNRYSYVLNNPLNYVDPDGREPQSTQITRVTMPMGTLVEPHFHEIGPGENPIPIANGKLGKEADAGGPETQLNYQYEKTDLVDYTVTFTTIAVNGSYGDPITGEGASCSTSTRECVVADISFSTREGYKMEATTGTVIQSPFHDPSEEYWINVNLSPMSAQQLAALRGTANSKHMKSLVDLIDQELDRRKREAEKKNKKKKKKDIQKPGNERMGPTPTKSQ